MTFPDWTLLFQVQTLHQTSVKFVYVRVALQSHRWLLIWHSGEDFRFTYEEIIVFFALESR